MRSASSVSWRVPSHLESYTPKMLFNPRTPDPSYGNTIPSVHDTPGAEKKQVVLTPHDIPWSLREQRVYPSKKCWLKGRQTSHVCRLSYLGQKVTFSGGRTVSTSGGESCRNFFPRTSPPFPAQVDTGARTRVLDLGGRIGEKGGGATLVCAWQAIYWKNFLKVSSWMLSVSLLRIGEKTQVGQFESPNIQRILREKNGGDFTRYTLKSYLSVWCFGLPASNLLTNLCPRPLLFLWFPSSSKPSVTRSPAEL